MLSIGLNLCAPTPIGAQCGNDFTTCRPTNASCDGTTLTLLSATLGDPTECIRCPDGTNRSLPMTLTIQNNGPVQNAVAIWARVTRTNVNGSTNCLMSRCSEGMIVAAGISTVSLGNIQYRCGDEITLSNIILTSTTGTCADLTACNTPCSRTLGAIAVTLPHFNDLSATATATQTCRGASDGSITVAVTGGTSPYTFTIAPGGTTNTTGIFPGLAANNYNVVVVDANGCRVRVTDIVVSPKDLTVTCPPGDGGTYACVGDVPAADNSIIGISNNVQGCQVNITSADVRNNGTGCVGNPLIITRTYTIIYGRTITNCVQTFTVIDNIAPVVTAGSIASCYKTVAEAEAAAITATTATDNCGNVIKTAITVGDCAATITVTGTDACGNNASVSYQTRIDNTAPTATNTDLGTLLTCNEPLPLNPESFITATDNCPGRVAISAPSEWAASGAAENCIVTYTRSYTITDECGNSATVIQTVRRKEDRTPPSFTTADLAQTLTCDQYKALTADFGSLKPRATDGCLGEVTVTYVSNDQTQLCETGSFTITWLATDACGNSSTTTQMVHVIDYTNPPVLTQGSIATCYPTAAAAEVAALAATTIQNNCVGVIRTTVSSEGTCQATVWVTVIDGCGRRVRVAYNTRIDNTPPVVGNTNLGNLGCNVALPTGNIITATDDCGLQGITQLSNWENPITNNCVVTYTRRFIATDACGNTTTATQTVSKIKDRVDPVFEIADLIKTLTCAEYQALEGNYSSLQPRVTDNCLGTITLTSRVNANAATTICNQRSFRINWSAIDACGNRVTAVQTVHINTPILAATVTVSCTTTGGIIIANITGGCGPYSYVLTCETGGATSASSNTVWNNVANGNYTVIVTDVNGCTVSRNVRVNCRAFCTMTQGDLGNNGRPNCPAVDALMATPITVGSGSRTLTLNTKECVVSLLPSTGTAAALSVSHTCNSCSSCTNCECTNCGFPSNLTITDNRLLGHTLALALSLRKPENLNLGALRLNEICGLEIPRISNVSGVTTVSGLLTILNQALGGDGAYSSFLNRLSVLTQDIIAAYDNCANPCATNPCAIVPAARIVSESVPVQPNLVKQNLDFNVFPVPTTGVIQVALEEYLTQDITITVYTLTSQVVQIQDVTGLNQKFVTLDLGHLPDGTYLISVRSASQLPMSKVLIINK